jgi:hypothetical protein
MELVGDLLQVGGFLTNETDRLVITEILLKVALNTIKQINKHTLFWLGTDAPIKK